MTANPAKMTIGTLCAGLLLTGCVDSATPLMSGAQPVFGPEVRMHVYVLGEDRATGPEPGVFRWQGSEYRAVDKSKLEIATFTVYPLAGKDFLIQSRSARPQNKIVEYGIARRLADAVYVIGDIDANDTDAAARAKICAGDSSDTCRVSTRDGLLTLARASAAKPALKGSLAILVGEKP